MLAIPAKRADVSELSKTLKTFFTSKFPADSAHFENDITSFQQLRSAAVSITDPMDQVGQQHLLRYNYHVSVMVLRLNDFEKEMKLNFSWYDAYRPSRRFTSSNIYFDMAGVLWNMASFESTRAATMDRSTDEGVRQACRGFQQAAGIIDHILRNITPKIKSGLSPDLSNESLEMVKGLMLAQAQACFYEKAVRDRRSGGSMKPAVLSKLAFEASSLFSSALSYARIGTLVTALDSSWALTLQYQIESFGAAAEYWQSMVAKEAALQSASGYGIEIARLTQAESRAAQAVSLCQTNKFLSGLCSAACELSNAIKKQKADAVSDNAKIYLDIVPSPDSLSPLSGAKMVKPLDFPEYYNTEKPLFKDFTSSDIRAMVDGYRLQMNSLYMRQEEAVTTASCAARTALSVQGLPGSLEMYKSGGKLPDNLWHKVDQVQQLGGVPEIQRKLSEILASEASSMATFENISNIMQKENRCDDIFRSKFPQYTANIVPYSDQLFQNEIKESLSSLRQAAAIAGETNINTQAEVNGAEFVSQAKVLSMSRSELSEYLNSNGTAGRSNFLESVSVDTSGLEAGLVALASLIEQRDEVLKSFRASIDDTLRMAEENFLQRRISHPAESKDDAVSFFVAQESARVEYLKSLCQEQDGILSQISSLNENFVEKRQCDAASIARDTNIRTMEEAIAKFFELHGKLASGESFYTNLQMRLSKLYRSCEDIAFSQQLQRQEFEQNMIREQERSVQERKDQDMAQQLSADFSRLSARPDQPPSAAPTPFSGGARPQLASPHAAYGQPVQAPPGHSAPAYGSASLYPTSYGSSGSGVPVYQGNLHGRYDSASAATQPNPHQSGTAQHGYPLSVSQHTPISVPQGYGASPYSTQPCETSFSYQRAQQGHSVNYSYGTAPYSSDSHPAAERNPLPVAGGIAVDQKVKRLIDMGFETGSVQQALNMYNGNEEAAINYLLGGGGVAGSTNVPAQAAAVPPPTAETPSKKGWW